MSFLTAEWNNLAIVNYTIDPVLLEKFVPIGTELDLWQGKCYISLIGFMFEQVKVLGVKIPFHVNFEEVNLRFYVKRFDGKEWKRGVVFIKEIVPKHAITFVANTLYNEHYQTLPMKHQMAIGDNKNTYNYSWKKNKQWHSLEVITKKEPLPILVDSEAEFITEHYFGYTQFNANKSIEYEVRHPRWLHYDVVETIVKVNFEAVYGEHFSFLQVQNPVSTFFAIGSAISIEGKKVIEGK
jgi:uncharacterized protein